VSDESSLDKMWKLVESFGLKRVELDARGSLSFDQVRDLYLMIKYTHEKRTEEQIKLLEEELGTKRKKSPSKKSNYQQKLTKAKSRKSTLQGNSSQKQHID